MEVTSHDERRLKLELRLAQLEKNETSDHQYGTSSYEARVRILFVPGVDDG